MKTTLTLISTLLLLFSVTKFLLGDYWKSLMDKKIISISVFLIVAQGAEAYMMYYQESIPMEVFYNIYTVIEYIVVAGIIVSFEVEVSYKQVMQIVFIAGLILIICIELNKTGFNEMAFFLESVLILFLSVRILVLVYQTAIKHILQDSRFWFAAAVLIYFSVNVLISLRLNISFVQDIHSLINFIMNSILGAGLLCKQIQLKQSFRLYRQSLTLN